MVDSELALLKALNQWFATFDPDVVVGWSVIDFDFRLLMKRAAFSQIDLRLGRGFEKAHWRDSSNSVRVLLPCRGAWLSMVSMH